MKMKAQTAMEYLMTYGWAILIVIIVAAALYALGVFNPATWTQAAATGFTGFSVPTGGWKLDTGGAVTLILKNAAGFRMNITSITFTRGANTATNTTGVVLGAADSVTFTESGLGTGTAGSTYSITVSIVYDNLDQPAITGLTSSGTLTGTVS